MKLAIILSTNNAEKNWNAFRLGNLALKNNDNVNIFLIGEGVEYLKFSNEKFDIQKQVETFLELGKGEILACETCMVLRHQKGDKTCPVSGMKELYTLIKESDKVVTF
ncbi:MAG: DsrE family protein [Candidatus Levybacteria bacterium]|nr:DsrE family protein [Candidatus Levybacteria bacterium]